MSTSHIENLLSGWGSSQRQLPKNSQLMKNQIISQIKTGILKPERAPLSLPWMSFALTALGIVSLILINPAKHNTVSTISNNYDLIKKQEIADAPIAPQALQKQRMAQPSGSELGMGSTADSGTFAAKSRLQPAPDFYTSPVAESTPISDSREFLKIDYSATIRTRTTQETSTRLQTIIRGYGGRIDSYTNSPESAYISFVVPAGKLEAFKAEVKNIAGARFYEEQTSSTNLLGQKQNLEGAQHNTTDNLAQLNNNLNQLTQTHNQTVSSLQIQIAAASKKLKTLQNEATTDPSRMMQIQSQEQELSAALKNLRNKLDNENSNYEYQSSYINSQIQSAQATLKNLGEQTGELLETVATVRGTLMLQHISLGEYIGAYVSGYWVAAGFLALAILAFFWQKKHNEFSAV